MEATADAVMAPPSEAMLIQKRDGTKQPFSKDKLIKRVESLAEGLDKEYVTFEAVVDKVENGIYDGKIA